MRQTWTAVLLSGLLASSTGPVFPQAGKADPPSFAIDKGSVVRREAGQVRWATQLGLGINVLRPPQLVWDAKRVYVRHNDGVTALSTATGIILWQSPGPNDRLLVSRDRLLATEEAEDRGRWVIARTVTTGAEVCKFRLPAGAVAGLPQGEDRLLLTETEVVRVCPGKKSWATPLGEGVRLRGGGLVEADGGDLVAFSYGPISDSGVRLTRLNAATGKVAWRAHCAPLGVGHSQYLHDATVAIEGERIRVTSWGASGTFVEVLDLRKGKQLSRTVSKR
jgi:outer membrane protein assembly factor BamB